MGGFLGVDDDQGTKCGALVPAELGVAESERLGNRAAGVLVRLTLKLEQQEPPTLARNANEEVLAEFDLLRASGALRALHGVPERFADADSNGGRQHGSA